MPDSIEAAKLAPEQIDDLMRTQVALREEVARLKHQLDWFKRQVFGHKSERRIVDDSSAQMSLGEALAVAQRAPAPAPAQRRVAAHTRRLASKKADSGEDSLPFFDETRVPVEVIDLPAPETEGLAPQDYQIIGHKGATGSHSAQAISYEDGPMSESTLVANIRREGVAA